MLSFAGFLWGAGGGVEHDYSKSGHERGGAAVEFSCMGCVKWEADCV